MNEDDMIAAGFERLDPNLVEKRPPKIKWGLLYQGWPEAKKIEHLENLASSMNHAAYLIQNERDQLNELCAKKEAQIQSMKTALDQNNAMIQSEITRTNAEKQEYNKAIAALNVKVRGLMNGNNT